MEVFKNIKFIYINGIKRNDAISICKAIGIICMVSGHAWLGGDLEKGVKLIELPLFYLKSGYCFKEQYLLKFIEFLKKRVKGLWKPYVKWGIISILIHNIFLKIGLYSVDSLGDAIPYFSYADILNKIKSTIVFAEGPDGFLGEYWFLKDMFFATIISFWGIKLSCGKNINILYVSIVFLLLSVLYIPVGIKIPYIHTSMFFASALFCFGYYFKKTNIFEKIEKVNLWLVMASFVLVFVLAFSLAPLGMSSLYTEFFNVFYIMPFFFYSIFLTICLLVFATRADNRFKDNGIVKTFVFIGENTLSILTFHMLWFKLVNYIIYDLHPNAIGYFPTNIEYSSKGWCVAYIIAGLFLPLTYPYSKQYFKRSI